MRKVPVALRWKGVWLAVVLLLVVGGACGQASPPAAADGANTGNAPTFKVVDGLPYRTVDGESLLCDLYIPAGSGQWPVVLLLHGGGWSGGDRKQLRRQAAFLAERGFFGVAIDYRLAPAHPFPAALDDARAAVVWLHSHAAEYHFDAGRIAAVGSSAGGNLAALLGIASGSGSPAGTGVNAVVAFNGIYDLHSMPVTDMISRFLDGSCSAAAERCKQASPELLVHAGAPPFLLLHGTADKTAPYTQATGMLNALHAAHDHAELFTADGAPHTFWAQARWTEPSFQAMSAFLAKWLQAPPSR